jgi:hypothetical protein
MAAAAAAWQWRQWRLAVAAAWHRAAALLSRGDTKHLRLRALSEMMSLDFVLLGVIKCTDSYAECRKTTILPQ